MTGILRSLPTRVVLGFALAVTFVLSGMTTAEAAPPRNLSNGGFETGDLSGWSVTGNAFAVSSDTNWGWGGDFNHKGSKHVWGYKSAGDAGTGEMRSQVHYLWGSSHVDFLIGGGNNISNLYVALEVGGVEVLKATGNNDERYRRVIWDITPWANQAAYFKVVDRATGAWGHLNVDDFHATGDTIASTSWVELPNHDFESTTLTSWTATGTAFGPGALTTATTFAGGTFNKSGTRHIWGYKAAGDAPHGTLKSSNFILGGTGKVDFLIGGGNNSTALYVTLVQASTGKELFKATGLNSETYRRVAWDASLYIGETVYVKAVDLSGEAWGHINIDDVNVQARP